MWTNSLPLKQTVRTPVGIRSYDFSALSLKTVTAPGGGSLQRNTHCSARISGIEVEGAGATRREKLLLDMVLPVQTCIATTVTVHGRLLRKRSAPRDSYFSEGGISYFTP